MNYVNDYNLNNYQKTYPLLPICIYLITKLINLSCISQDNYEYDT